MNEFEFLKLQNILQIKLKEKTGFLVNRKIEKVQTNLLIFKIKLPQKSVTWKRNKGYLLFHLFLFLIFLQAK